VKRLSLLLLLFCGLLVPASAQDVTGLVDNGDGTITDTRSNLMWLKNANQGGAMTWDQGVAWATNLNVAGHRSWRLPSGANPDGSVCNSRPRGLNCTQTEFATLYFARRITTLSPGPFTNLQASSYWTGTAWPADTTRAMAQDFIDGGQNDFPKAISFPVWAVRNVSPGPPPATPGGLRILN